MSINIHWILQEKYQLFKNGLKNSQFSGLVVFYKFYVYKFNVYELFKMVKFNCYCIEKFIKI